MVPAGLATVIYLTRTFGPAGYGSFTLAATLAATLSWTTGALLGQPTIKLVGSLDDWRPVGTAAVNLALAIGLGLTLGLVVLAPWIASLLGDPALTDLLRLFAWELPFLSLASAHQCVLVGRGALRKQAISNGCRWPLRLVFIVLLVELGYGLPGAAVGSVLSGVAEFALARAFVQPPLWSRAPLPYGLLRAEASTLFLLSLVRQFFNRIDLFALQALTASTAMAGLYAAALNLCIVPSLFAGSLSSILLGSLSRLRRDGQLQAASRLSGEALRVQLLMLPIAGLTAGAADEVVVLVLGQEFAPAGPLLTILIFQALALGISTVSASILAAANRARLAVMLSLPLLPLTLGGLVATIPTHGPLGAAWTMLLAMSIGTLLSMLAVQRVWGAHPHPLMLVKTVLVTLAAFLIADWWSTPGPLVLVKLGLLVPAIGLAFLLLGELGRREIELARALIPGRR
jgi:O-antigen/teichoic acid export membrane protein